MRVGRWILLVPAGALLVATALAEPSCTEATSPVFPVGAVPVPPTFGLSAVRQLPALCAANTFFVAATALCAAGPTYFLCDGSSYTEYDCAQPGSGWTLETLSQDRVGSGPGACPAAASAPSGTVFVEANQARPGENEVLAFHYCGLELAETVAATYPTGGTGSADLNDTGILDADQQVIFDASHALLFAVNQGSDSIAAFHVASDATLTPVTGSPFSSRGTAPASLAVSGDILVVANKAVDGIRNLDSIAPSYATFTISGDGSLTPASPAFAAPVGASPTQVFVAPGGNLLFTTEESGILRAFLLSSSGALTESAGSPVSLPPAVFADGYHPNPVWPAGLSTAPNGSVLYTGVPNHNSIAAFDFTPDGALTLDSAMDDGPQGFLPCWSVVSADGSRLYFANAGSDSVSIWDVATDPRHPAILQTYELPGGGNPWGIHLDPTGKLLFVLTPRQVHQVPESQGQLLHALSLASDGTVAGELGGSPLSLPVPAGTNPIGLAIVPGN